MENVRYTSLLRSHLRKLRLMAEELSCENPAKSSLQFEAEVDSTIAHLREIKRLSRNRSRRNKIKFVWRRLADVVGLKSVSMN